MIERLAVSRQVPHSFT